MNRAVGSVLPLPAGGDRYVGSLWDLWSGKKTVSAYSCARSALCALLRHRGVHRIWLPAYLCQAAFDGASAGAAEVEWYGVDANLEPQIDQLADLQPGDAVLTVAYFGRPASDTLRKLAAARPDVLWVEDRAQALDISAAPWSDVELFSPRKLIGIADGGLLVGEDLPQPANAAGDHPPSAQAARAADPVGEHPERWFSLFQAQEVAFAIEDVAMTPLSEALLKATSAAPLSQARQRNYRALADRLAQTALWPHIIQPSFAPLAFPVLTADPAAVVAALAGEGIYCARHWPDLPSPARFETARQISASLVSLPCDHRYDEDDMDRVADAFLQAAR